MKNYVSALVRNRSDLEDVIQDTFMKAWARLSAFRFEATFRTWLISIALNEAFALHRRRKCRVSCIAIPTLDRFPSHAGTPHQVFARSETRARVRTAISKLPAKYREVVVLCELEQLTARETARRMKASIPLVKTRLLRARHMLSAALNEDAA
ncbi:MAG: RNA polymerase sigma factor [Acidobacteriaceae bacterium]|nr:RNA polymerase sigma factor [Acidobacteriaceae bacterium]